MDCEERAVSFVNMSLNARAFYLTDLAANATRFVGGHL
jgi:hypothetical protein